jgi:hypothetical protein
MQFYQEVQKLLAEDTQTNRQTDRHTGDLISLLSFTESGKQIVWLGVDWIHLAQDTDR